MEISAEIKGLKEIEKKLNKKFDFKTALKNTEKLLKTEFQDLVFETQGKSLGKPWAPRKGIYNHPPLQKTGKMRKSFQTQSTESYAKIINPVFYFKFHQLGTTKMVARQMFGITERFMGMVKEEFEKIIKKWLNS